MSNPIIKLVDLTSSIPPPQAHPDIADRHTDFNIKVQRIITIGASTVWAQLIYTAKWELRHRSVKTIILSIDDLQRAFLNLPASHPIKEDDEVHTRCSPKLFMAASRQLGLAWLTNDRLVDLAVMIGIACAFIAQKQRCEGDGFFNGLHVTFELKWMEGSSIDQLA